MAESQISEGVNEFGTLAVAGSNERAFHIIKVICIAVENLIWAVNNEKGNQTLLVTVCELKR